MADPAGRVRLLRRLAAGCAVAVVAAATYALTGAGSGTSATEGLRTATVGTGAVEQTLTVSGTVRRVDQLSVSFPAGGRVTSVRVAVGDEVRAGQVLATIDPTQLAGAVTVAAADLVAAQAALDEPVTTSASVTSALTGSSGSGGTRAGATGASTPPTAAPPHSSHGGSTSTHAAPGGGVDTAAAHAAAARAAALLAAVTDACAPVLAASGDGPTPPTTAPTTAPTPTVPTSTTTTPPTTVPATTVPATTVPTSTTTTTSPTVPTGTATTPPTTTSSSPTPTSTTATTSVGPTSTTTTSGHTADQLRSCVGALGAALAAQQDGVHVVSRIAEAITTAATALQAAQAGGTPSGARSATGATDVTGDIGAAGDIGDTRGTGGSRSRADLEVGVLRAQQALASAQQSLAGATLRAPIAGRVGAVGLSAGQNATSSSAVVVVGAGTALLTVDVPLARLGLLRVGQPATVVPAGATSGSAGVIDTIGVLPTSTSSASPSYPVTIAVSSAPVSLATGATAEARITVASVAHAVTVPVSALAGTAQGTGTVTVLTGARRTPTRVTVGAVGRGLAQVTGVVAGQVVLLADPSRPLPAATAGTNVRRLGGGGFGGGGFGGGRGAPGPS